MRHVAILRGGPLDGQLVTVAAQQNEVVGLGIGDATMGDDGVYDREEAAELESLIDARDVSSAELAEVEPLPVALERLFPGQTVEAAYFFGWRG